MEKLPLTGQYTTYLRYVRNTERRGERMANVTIKIKGNEQIEQAMKKLEEAIQAVHIAAEELTMLGVNVEITPDKWKSRQ